MFELSAMLGESVPIGMYVSASLLNLLTDQVLVLGT